MRKPENLDSFKAVKSLPNLDTHNFIDRIWLGRSYPRLHKRMDKPVFWLGRRHRELFHDLPSAYYLASREYPNDERAFASAELHLYYDELCSADPSYKRYLEELAKLDKQRKRASKKKRPKKKKDDLDACMQDLIRLVKLIARLRSRRFRG